MQSYMDDLLHGRREKFASYFDGNNYIQHNPWVADNLTGLLAGLQALAKEGKTVKYQRVEKVLGEGSFVLVVSEGTFGDRPTAYYDLYRVQNGKIAEHSGHFGGYPAARRLEKPEREILKSFWDDRHLRLWGSSASYLIGCRCSCQT